MTGLILSLMRNGTTWTALASTILTTSSSLTAVEKTTCRCKVPTLPLRQGSATGEPKRVQLHTFTSNFMLGSWYIRLVSINCYVKKSMFRPVVVGRGWMAAAPTSKNGPLCISAVRYWVISFAKGRLGSVSREVRRGRMVESCREC